MPGMSQARRLAALMEERRLDLGLRWTDVAAESGMSVEGLRTMRRDGAVPRALNQRGIERALRWEPGSIGRILRGEDPVPVAAPEQISDDELDQLEAELGVDLSHHDPSVRRDWLSVAAAVLRKAAADAERERDERKRA
jgi:hypothetical protein